jgi:hypothetical protein
MHCVEMADAVSGMAGRGDHPAPTMPPRVQYLRVQGFGRRPEGVKASESVWG